MSFFDQPYYALTKSHATRVGVWPEQSKHVRIFRPLLMFAMTMTLVVPGLIRLFDDWRDTANLINSATYLLLAIATYATVLSSILQTDNIVLSLKCIEEHWKMIKNTSAVIILERYAERGRKINAVYSSCAYIVFTMYIGICLSPTILEFVNPLNETRRKIYIIEAEYGVDADKYYWLILAHGLIVITMTLSIMVAFETMYLLWVVHACALFEVVGFNLKLAACDYSANKENSITPDDDWNYKKLSYCIAIHAEAISYADLVETGCSGSAGVVLGIIAIIIIITGVQLLFYWSQPDIFVQKLAMTCGHICHLYLNSIPGQELINHSERIHTTAYNLDWQNMSVKAQKLLIPLLVRSNIPCRLTAGKVIVLCMESFAKALQTVISYFMVFAKLMTL